MEIRKVQVTGGSTYTVSIPKEWARENDVSGGTSLAMFPNGNSMVIETLGEEDGKTSGSMEISGVEGEHLVRSIMMMYVSGFDILRFEARRITTSQRKTLRQTGQQLAGLEVIEETGDVVVFQDLLDSGELSVHRTVSRIRLIAESMFKDSVKALIDGDDEIADDVIERDDDADRMFAMVSRIFRTSLRDARSEEELGITREECFDYHTAARQLERIADHATKIAEVEKEVENSAPDEIYSEIEERSEEAIGIVEDAILSLLEHEGDEAINTANEALDSVPEIQRKTRELGEEIHELDAETSQRLGLVIDSINRVADYGANIAETSLQSAAPKP